MEYFENLEPLLRSFWYIALASSIIFVLQTILTFIGADATDGIDADFDGDFNGADAPFQLFSLRNLINFLLGLSWAGISFYSLIPNKFLLVILSLIIGILFVFVFFIIIKQLQKLGEDNSFKITNTINKSADVYLTIPEKKTGKGKIMISINGAFHELDAMSESASIQTGSVVKVVKVENNNILIVETI